MYKPTIEVADPTKLAPSALVPIPTVPLLSITIPSPDDDSVVLC